ncbi:hypothetical protein KC19_9G178800 [Ceratodon purpureus]|uniref:3-hydroxy-3-methylglutaryl coenzyme A reductase n=1 Tax=Ceratodon purpureus TaxID=3225 RepID=A0A8T0GWF9_CERPU|nr:hypothetical protein KC19_9G178800 [Ceratodon purpureus]
MKRSGSKVEFGNEEEKKQRGEQSPGMKRREKVRNALASDALPLPVGLTNKIFIVSFFVASYFLMRSWREKIRNSTPLHMLNLGEIVALLIQLSSFIYLIGFFGIDYVQGFIGKSGDGVWDSDDEREQMRMRSPGCEVQPQAPKVPVQLMGMGLEDNEDEDIARAVSNGEVPSYSLETQLGDPLRGAAIRRRAVELTTGRSLEGLPLAGMDYSSIMGQCCEMVVGYVQVPVGVAGPLLLNGHEFTVPMGTTEGCLVASTNRGCKAIYQSGGATSILLQDGMTRAPVVRFPTVKRCADLKFFLEDPNNFDTISHMFNRTSRFARLKHLKCQLAGRNVYIRFTALTGDAMGMNMISKGVQNVLDYLQDCYPDMEVISVSGNFCADKKPTAVNWIDGRGKSVVCEAILKEEVIRKVLKTSVSALVELNMVKNLAGSALAGAIGGFNAHASNIVSAIYIATGQDPAQNVESSQCITMMEAVNGGRDLHVSVTMPSIEVGTIGGGTQLASQSACLNLLGVKGANTESPGANAQLLARVVAGTVLAGEISLMSALAAGQLVKSHMKYNRSNNNIAAVANAALPPLPTKSFS